MKASITFGHGNANHNDRSFKDPGDRKGVLTWNCYGEKISFTQAEKRFYEEHFSEFLKDRNRRYSDNRQKDRVMSMKQFMKSPRYQPTELLLQIGNKDEYPDHEILKKVTSILRRDLEQKGFSVINMSVHLDESTPHVHLRGVFIQKLENGMEQPNKSACLKQHGYEPPDPTRKESRYNTRLITFTNEARQHFYDLVEQHGIKLDREVHEKRRHEPTREYSTRKQRELEKQIDTASDRVEALLKQEKDVQQENDRLMQENEAMRQEIAILKQEYSVQQKQNEDLQSENGVLRRKNDELRCDNEELAPAVQAKMEYLEIKKNLDFDSLDKYEMAGQHYKDAMRELHHKGRSR